MHALGSVVAILDRVQQLGLGAYEFLAWFLAGGE